MDGQTAAKAEVTIDAQSTKEARTIEDDKTVEKDDIAMSGVGEPKITQANEVIQNPKAEPDEVKAGKKNESAETRGEKAGKKGVGN